MTNCTSAIHASLLASGVKRNDEVIVPAYTWGGTITGLLQIGAVPVFADIDDTLTLDVDDIKSKITGKTKAVIAVHLFGHPCDMESLTTICSQNNLALIEDCAQAFGAKINGRYVGSFGIGCFSFGYRKPLSAAICNIR
jgi:perosamine synthetase